MDELTNKAILLSGIEDKDGKISLMEQSGEQKYPTKYSFFKKKANSEEETKAFEQYQELKPETGKVYKIAVRETQGVNKMSGKPVTYRNIAYFVTGDIQTPVSPQNSAQVKNGAPTQQYRPTKEAMGNRKEIERVMDKKETSISQFQAKKESSMQHLAICRDATLLAIAEFNGTVMVDKEEMKKSIKEWNVWLKSNIYDVPFV